MRVMRSPTVMKLIAIVTLLASNTNELEQSSQNKSNIPKGCACVSIHDCPSNAMAEHGLGRITFRLDIEGLNPCPSFSLRVCCPPGGQADNPPSSATIELENPKHESQPENPSLESQPRCGTRNSHGIRFRIIEESNTVSQFAEFPWMVLVFSGTVKNGRIIKNFVSGGSLIHESVVLTSAHNIKGLSISNAGVRAGDWDTNVEDEPLKHQDLAVTKIIIHDRFDEDYFLNDIALLITESPFKLTPNVGIVCLPKANSVVKSSSCLASGWGKNMTGHYQKILKKIDQLPIVDRKECQAKLRSWSPDYSEFELRDSALCAGGIKNKDTCQGDGGGPLVCPINTDSSRLQQVGITSWGLKCGSDFPAVYTNVAHFRHWIDKNMDEHKFNPGYNY